MIQATQIDNITGYVQQQDLHLETSTVREALCFSAMLRQPSTTSKEEKYSHVEDVIEVSSILACIALLDS